MPDLGIGEALVGTALGELLFGGGLAAEAGALGGVAEAAGGLGAAIGGAEAAGAAGLGLGAAEAGALGGVAEAAGGLGAAVPGAAEAAGGLAGTAAALGGPEVSGFASALGGVAPEAPGGIGAAVSGAAETATFAAPGVETGAGGFGEIGSLSGVSPAAPAGPGAAPLPGNVAPGTFDLTSNFAAGPGANTFTGVENAATTGAGGAPVESLGAPGVKELAPAAFGADAPMAAQQSVLSQGWDAVTGGLKEAGQFLNSPTSKALGVGVSGLGLLKNLTASQDTAGSAQLRALASQLGGMGLPAQVRSQAEQANSQGAVLRRYLIDGTLPPALQATLDRTTNDAVVALKSQYAARGVPPGSSSEIADIAALKQEAVVKGGSLAAQLFSQGASLQDVASRLYSSLLSTSAQASAAENQTSTAQNNAVNAAIANLSGALGGGRVTNPGTQAAA
jgi:hypothetical protein